MAWFHTMQPVWVRISCSLDMFFSGNLSPREISWQTQLRFALKSSSYLFINPNTTNKGISSSSWANFAATTDGLTYLHFISYIPQTPKGLTSTGHHTSAQPRGAHESNPPTGTCANALPDITSATKKNFIRRGGLSLLFAWKNASGSSRHAHSQPRTRIVL